MRYRAGVRSVDSQALPTCSSFGAALRQSISTFPEGLDSPFGPTFGCSISTIPKGLDSVNLKNPAILSRERIGTDPPPRVDSFAPAHHALRASASPRETIWFGFISSQISQLEVGDGVAGEYWMT